MKHSYWPVMEAPSHNWPQIQLVFKSATKPNLFSGFTMLIFRMQKKKKKKKKIDGFHLLPTKSVFLNIQCGRIGGSYREYLPREKHKHLWICCYWQMNGQSIRWGRYEIVVVFEGYSEIFLRLFFSLRKMKVWYLVKMKPLDLTKNKECNLSSLTPNMAGEEWSYSLHGVLFFLTLCIIETGCGNFAG